MQFNVNQATCDYLEQHVIKEKEHKKIALQEEAAVRLQSRVPKDLHVSDIRHSGADFFLACSTLYSHIVQDERCKCCQHEHEEDAAEEVVLAELAKHQKPTPDHALVANDTNNVVIEKEAAAIQVVKPSNNALAPAFEPISMFEVTPMKNCLNVSWEILTCSCPQY
ncbi:unnamed protein product [Sphagnum tenellum]